MMIMVHFSPKAVPWLIAWFGLALLAGLGMLAA